MLTSRASSKENFCGKFKVAKIEREAVYKTGKCYWRRRTNDGGRPLNKGQPLETNDVGNGTLTVEYLKWVSCLYSP